MFHAIGKLKDLEKYPEFYCFQTLDNYSWEKNQEWLDFIIEMNLPIIVVSSEVTGIFARELEYLKQFDIELFFVG